MTYDNWQKKKIYNSSQHQEEIFNLLNNQNYVSRKNKKIILDDNKEYTEFISCSYLGLDQDHRVISGVADKIDDIGLSFLSSRTRMKYCDLNTLEEMFNSIFTANTVIFSTTHLVHLGLIPLIASGEMPSIEIASNGCCFLLDTSVHASIQINRGLMQQFGQVELLDLSNLILLDTKLKQVTDQGLTPLLFSDGICSMGGLLPLKDLMQLTNKYKGYLYLDDAHGMSIYGKNGAGYAMHEFNHDMPDRLILTTSLGKGFGTCGGIVALKNPEDAKFVKMHSSTYMFSGTLINPLINASIESARIHLSEEISFLQKILVNKIGLFDSLVNNPDKVVNWGCNTPIRGIYIGDEFAAIESGLRLKEAGFLGVVATYPIRKKGEAIIRLLVCANHSDEEIQQICKIINLMI